MCGIFCSISRTELIRPSDELQQRLHHRGPDSQRTICRTHNGLHLTFTATVLSLRGSKTVSQPLVNGSGDYVLCWNGEAWSIDDVPQIRNDTEAVFAPLVDAVKTPGFDDPNAPAQQSAKTVAAAMSRVAGPYAFVFYDARGGKLYLGRDFLGRRSLMIRTADDGDGLLIGSVSDGDAANHWTELDALGVYCIDLQQLSLQNGPNGAGPTTLGPFDATLAPYRFADKCGTDSKVSISAIPRHSLNKTDSVHPPEPLSVDSQPVTRLEALLRASLSLRVLNIPDPPCSLDDLDEDFNKARIAVLFSGGLDCTVLARIAHDLLPLHEPVDLLNVAFENPRIHKTGPSADGSTNASFELCPDRITGRASYTELREICPGREWRFIAIDVPFTESQQHRSTVISLMSPHNTEMDLSISLALYFAARGKGQIHVPDQSAINGSPYTTSARVLLSGLGADELFGGYTRHATAYHRGGMTALLDELELDVSRLGSRNLGRDDRVMSHWSREIRFPYLDENVVGWALDTPVEQKCGFGESGALDDDIEPGKKVLRCLASKLGMNGVAMEKKRAIQFGARTAKMETRKTKGTTVLSP